MSTEAVQAPLDVEAPGSVGKLARPALGWSVVNTILTRLGSTLVGIAMARILVPEDYGVFAIAVVALNAILSLNELGVSLAVVRWPGDPRRIAASVNTIAIIGSSLLCIGGFLLAPTIASALQAPEATGVLRLLLLVALIDGITSVPAALLTRAFRQRTRTFIDMAALVVTSAVGLSLALTGGGAWSLAFALVAGNVLTSLAILLVTLPYPGFEFNGGLWKELIAFGAPLSIASALAFLMLNVDYVVVGNRLGSEDLGVYFLAFGLASFPVLVISTTIRRVAMPAFARLAADRDRLVASVLNSLQLLLAVTLPGCAALAFLADPIVDVLYGSKWAAAAAPLAPLAVLAAIRIVTELLYDLHVAMAWTGRVMWIQLVWLVALVPTLVVGASSDGIRGVAIGQVVVGGLIGLPLFLLALRRIGIGVSALARVAWPAVAASLVVGVVVLGLERVIPSQVLLLIVALPLSLVGAAAVQRRQVWPLVAPFLGRTAVGGG